jgi:hypothetical protein
MALTIQREIAIHVLGELLARDARVNLLEDGSVDPTSFSDTGGFYEFVDIAMFGGVDYCAIFQRRGGPDATFIAYGNTVAQQAVTNPGEPAAGADPADVPQESQTITNTSEAAAGPDPAADSPVPTVTNPSEITVNTPTVTNASEVNATGGPPWQSADTPEVENPEPTIIVPVPTKDAPEVIKDRAPTTKAPSERGDRIEQTAPQHTAHPHAHKQKHSR